MQSAEYEVDDMLMGDKFRQILFYAYYGSMRKIRSDGIKASKRIDVSKLKESTVCENLWKAIGEVEFRGTSWSRDLQCRSWGSRVQSKETPGLVCQKG